MSVINLSNLIYSGTQPTAVVTSDIGVTVQAQLVSNTNIKTVNNQSVLGSGNIVVDAMGDAIVGSILFG